MDGETKIILDATGKPSQTCRILSFGGIVLGGGKQRGRAVVFHDVKVFHKVPRREMRLRGRSAKRPCVIRAGRTSQDESIARWLSRAITWCAVNNRTWLSAMRVIVGAAWIWQDTELRQLHISHGRLTKRSGRRAHTFPKKLSSISSKARIVCRSPPASGS